MYENIDKIEFDTNKYFFLERYPKRLKYLQDLNIIQENLIEEHLKLIDMKINKKPENTNLVILIDNKIVELYDKEKEENKNEEESNQENKNILKSSINKCEYFNLFSDYIQIPSLLQVYLNQFNYQKLSKIQKILIPNLFNKNDIFANCLECSGKTLSYLVPIISFLWVKESVNKIPINDIKSYPIVLIIGENKEKLNRKLNECLQLTYETNILSVGIEGDGGKEHSEYDFFGGCDILFCTTESLTYSLKNNLISLSCVKFLVIDTIDDILNIIDQKYLLRLFDKYDLGNKYQRTNIIFSSKYNKEILDVTNLILKENHLVIKVKDDKLTKIEEDEISLTNPQKFFYIETGLIEDKLIELKSILSKINGTRIIFVNKEKDYNYLKFKLNNLLNNQNLFLTTDLESKKLKEKLKDKQIDFIINFDFPSSFYVYEYRVQYGGINGKIISLIVPENKSIFKQLRNILTKSNQPIPEFMDIPKPKIKENEGTNNDGKSEKNSDKSSSKDDKKSNKSKRSYRRTKTNTLGKNLSKTQLNKESSSKTIKSPKKTLKYNVSKKNIDNYNNMNEIEIKSNKNEKSESFNQNERKIERVYTNESLRNKFYENMDNKKEKEKVKNEQNNDTIKQKKSNLKKTTFKINNDNDKESNDEKRITKKNKTVLINDDNNENNFFSDSPKRLNKKNKTALINDDNENNFFSDSPKRLNKKNKKVLFNDDNNKDDLISNSSKRLIKKNKTIILNAEKNENNLLSDSSKRSIKKIKTEPPKNKINFFD